MKTFTDKDGARFAAERRDRKCLEIGYLDPEDEDYVDGWLTIYVADAERFAKMVVEAAKEEMEDA